MTPQTKYVIEAYVVIPASYRDTVNAKFEGYGLGPNSFAVGLSASGEAPAQAHHARIPLKRTDLKKVLWFADNAPRAWMWIRVRTEYLRHAESRELCRLRDNFDLKSYQDVHWQTRDKAYIKISTQPISANAALQWLSNNADPAVILQSLTE